MDTCTTHPLMSHKLGLLMSLMKSLFLGSEQMADPPSSAEPARDGDRDREITDSFALFTFY